MHNRKSPYKSYFYPTNQLQQIHMYTPQQEKKYFELSKQFLANEVSLLDIELLRDTIRYHEWKYSIRNSPVLADYEYDMLYKILEKIEAANPGSVTLDSPTQRVSSDLVEVGNTVEHTVPMLSLGNSYNAEDLQDFDRQVRKHTGLDEDTVIYYTVEPKYDGGSIALLYEDDYLVRAATRGNGTRGEEMTANAKTLSSIPLKADFSSRGIKKVELRGEALIRKDNFDRVNAERESLGQSIFANPRNAATGGLRTKDPSETRRRGIEAFIFQLGYAVDGEGNDVLSQMTSHFDAINLLGDIGFKIPLKEKKRCKGIKEVVDFINEWAERRDDYEYEIDGMVVKVDEYSLQKACGYTSHHPRWAIAYKFKAKQATTTLNAVEYQVGKIGSITPVAKVAPTQLAGVTVSSISLHNEEFITTKDLRLGDKILIERAGDVIPYVVKSLEELRDGTEEVITFPAHCPINQTEVPAPLEKVEGEAAWRCNNCVCGAQNLQKMIFHVSKSAMDIDGFGKSLVEKFYELGWVKDIADIYNLDYSEIQSLEGFGERSALKLRASIDKAKANPIKRLLHSLSVHHLGKKASSLIAEEIDHVLDLQTWTEEDFINIKDIGPVVAQNVAAYFAVEDNIEMLRKMEGYGVNLTQTEDDKPLVVAEDAPLSGKSILFTGSLQTMNRKEAQQLAAEQGAKNISAVSSKLDILVVGEKAGSKLKKAQALKTVQILTEAEFNNLIGRE